jgi:RNA polymerase sigma-70 factor (ECF subfamily)
MDSPELQTSDAELVAATCDGDDSAFAELFERHRRRVTAIAGRFFHQPVQIEEIVQESFTKAYFALYDFLQHKEDCLPAWLARIGLNTC